MDVKQIILAAGGVRRISKEILRSHSTVSEWKRIPAPHAQAIANLSGIPLWEIRPDVFPAPTSDGQAA